MKEIWKEIPDSEGAYDISNHGQIRSYYTKIYPKSFGKGPRYIIDRSIEPRLLKSWADKKHYLGSCIKIGGKIKRIEIHRLVAICFLGKPKQGMTAAHQDGNKFNNRSDNLKWLSVRDNHLQKINHGTDNHGEKHPFAKFTWVQIREMRALYKSGKSASFLTKKYNLKRNYIYKILNQRAWKEAS